MSGTRIHIRGRVGRLAAALAVAGGTVTVTSVALGVGPAPAGATSCGVALGAPQLEGALGSLVVVVQAVPTVPGEACNATIAVTGTIATPGGARPTNVAGNGAATAVTVSFLPGEPGPDILWQWSPHCADPASLPYDFFVSSSTAGVTSALISPVSPCSDFGNVTSSTLRAPIVLVPNPAAYVAFAGGDGDLGYWLIQRGGGISPFGTATNAGMPFTNVSVAGIANAGGGGYWVAAADGGVFAFGGAPFFGSMGGIPLNAPIVGIAATPDHGGYWLGAADGGVYAFGDAAFYGSVPGVLPPGARLNQPVVGIAGSQDGKGYWMVAEDGGVFAFGDARFWGSMGGIHLNKPVVGMAQNGLGGYWLVASDGGIFSFDAAFRGSLGSIVLNAPVTGMAGTTDGRGYWMVTADGGAFAFGDAPFWGSAA
jgi:hypothetical protein